MAAVVKEVDISDENSGIEDGVHILNIVQNIKNESSQTENSCALQALGETIRNTLLEITELRERNCERRHRELLQILEKMVQQEHMTKDEGKDSITNLSSKVLNRDEQSNTCEYNVEKDCLKKYSNKDEFACIKRYATAVRNISGQSDGGSTLTSTSSSSQNIKLLRKPEQITPGKTKIDTPKDFKAEFQKMRVKMMELQRQKMEDREKKKLKFTQTQNN